MSYVESICKSCGIEGDDSVCLSIVDDFLVIYNRRTALDSVNLRLFDDLARPKRKSCQERQVFFFITQRTEIPQLQFKKLVVVARQVGSI